MHRTTTTRRRITRRTTAVVLAAAIAAAGVVTAIAAVGDNTSSGTAIGIRAAGNASIGNSNGGAIVTASNLKPGGSAVGDVTITNQGDPSAFSLSKSGLQDVSAPKGGPISNLLQLKVEDLTNPGPALYDSSLSGFGPMPLGTFANNEARTYRFTVTLPSSADNTSQGASATVDFNWDATAFDIPDTGGGGGGGTTTTTTQQSPPPPGGTTSTPGGFTPSGPTAAILGFGGSTTQTTTDFVTFFGTCSQNCTASIGGTVNVPGATKVFRLKKFSKALRAGTRTKIIVRFPIKIRNAVRKAIRRRKVVTVTLSVTTKNAAGLTRSSTRRIRIKHR